MHIRLHKLKVKTRIGVHDWEKVTAQTLELYLDLELQGPLSFDKDELESTLDYSAVENAIITWAENRQTQLLERFVTTLSAHLMTVFPRIKNLEIEVFKRGALSHTDAVSVLWKTDRSLL